MVRLISHACTQTMEQACSHAGQRTGQLFVAAFLATALTACGGSSGDSIGEQDLDEDGIANYEDPDADGDGLIDATEDDDVDLDGDGENDVLSLQDFDDDGIINALDADADGDGLEDSFEDTFVDLDEDGLDDLTGQPENQPENMEPDFTPVSASAPCGSESGTVNDGSAPEWNDNCVLKRQADGGQFADSLYTAGMQRIVYCTADPASNAPASSYAAFADGEFGPGTQSALQAFQRDNSLVDGGIVGPATWAALQGKLELLEEGVIGDNGGRDTYGFSTGRCANVPLFYQATSFAADGLSINRGGWTLARNTPNEAQAAPFSVGSPFNVL